MKGSDIVDEIKAMFNPSPVFSFKIGSFSIGISTSLIIQWVIMLLIVVGCILLTRNLKNIPDKRQSAVEIFVETVNKLVKETMGEDYSSFGPYVGTIILFLIFMNFTGLVGFEPPTQNYSVALGMGLTTFFVIQGYTIKKIGVPHYLMAYGKPYFFLTPINILERVMLPVSLSLRLFGNMMAASVMMKLIYIGLGGLMPFFAQLGLPIFAHAYFDVFDGAVQMVIFTMLTMVNIKIIAEH